MENKKHKRQETNTTATKAELAKGLAQMIAVSKEGTSKLHTKHR